VSREVSICVFAGHTGGHLFPALAFAERFKQKFPESRIYLVTSPKARPILASHASGVFDRVDFLNEFPLPAGRPAGEPRLFKNLAGISLRTLNFLLEFGRAFLLSSRYLKKMKPDLCVGFGSYVSYPGMKLAVWKKIPTLIHEQNKIAGKATRMLARHVQRVAASFGETECRPEPKRMDVVGLPLRLKLYQARQTFRRQFDAVTPEKPFRILVTGGSQGAHRLNEAVLQSFSLLSPEERKKIVVNHSTGTQDLEWVTENYRRLGMQNKTFSFYENMQDLYTEADLAITRAGANTLFELALFNLPAIVVPYPHAAENHQEANAHFFESRGAAVLRTEKELTPEWLSGKIREMMSPEIRMRYADGLTQIAPQDAAVKLTETASELLSKEKTWELSTAI
jgi:UDP-N-acetylglucosamine--N-acetylmuramyl-(pentapeptide) pyrophosphoryl-undecaprenol N-acetylglucosamine transferase